MMLTEQNVDYVAKNLELYGLNNKALKEDLLDHICIHIENTIEGDFEEALQAAIQKFGGYSGLNSLQRDTHLQLYFKAAKNRYRLLCTMGLLNSIVITIGVLFKIAHWPYAGIILAAGFTLLIVATLPIYFYAKYKDKSLKYLSQFEN